MPVVALVLGVGLLGESLTIGAVAGLILIALGAWLAAYRPTRGTGGTTTYRNLDDALAGLAVTIGGGTQGPPFTHG